MVQRGKSLPRWFYEVIARVDRDQFASKKEKYEALLKLCLDIIETNDISSSPSYYVAVLRESREYGRAMDVDDLGYGICLIDEPEQEATEEEIKMYEKCHLDREIQKRMMRAIAIANNRRKRTKETCKTLKKEKKVTQMKKNAAKICQQRSKSQNY